MKEKKEDEVLNVRLLPSWFKKGARVDINVGSRAGYYGIIKNIAYSDKYEDNISRAKVDVPGVGSFIYKVTSISKSVRK